MQFKKLILQFVDSVLELFGYTAWVLDESVLTGVCAVIDRWRHVRMSLYWLVYVLWLTGGDTWGWVCIDWCMCCDWQVETREDESVLTGVCAVIDRWRHVRMRSRVSSLLRFWSCCSLLVISEHALRDCHPLTRYGGLYPPVPIKLQCVLHTISLIMNSLCLYCRWWRNDLVYNYMQLWHRRWSAFPRKFHHWSKNVSV